MDGGSNGFDTRNDVLAGEVEIDNVVPLAYAWDTGASAWPRDVRTAVAKAANASKSDHGPGTWVPGHVAYRCQYVIRWVAVVRSYGLGVAPGDRDVLRRTLQTCAR